MKKKQSQEITETKHFINEWAKDLYFRFIKMNEAERAEVFEMFDEANRVFADKPNPRSYFANLRNVFQCWEVK